LWSCCCFDDEGKEFGTAVSMVNASIWVYGCPVEPSGLLASMDASWGYIDVCRWVVWGICLAEVLASVVMVRT
jgi:hypothetical protein